MWQFVLRWLLIFGAILGGTCLIPGIIMSIRYRLTKQNAGMGKFLAYLLTGNVFSFCGGLLWFIFVFSIGAFRAVNGDVAVSGKLEVIVINGVLLNGIAGYLYLLIRGELLKDQFQRHGRLIAGLISGVNIGMFVGFMLAGMIAKELRGTQMVIVGIFVCQMIGGLTGGFLGGFICGSEGLFTWLMTKFSNPVSDNSPYYQGWIVGATAATIGSAWITSMISFGIAHGILVGLAMILMGWLVAAGFCLFMVPIGGLFIGFPGAAFVFGVSKALVLAQNLTWKIARKFSHSELVEQPVQFSQSPKLKTLFEKTPQPSQSSSQPRIKKELKNEQHLCFYIQKEIMGFLKSRIILELTPTEVKLKDKYYGFGRSWKIPTTELRPSYITWYFKEKKPVLGINYKKKTYPISSQLTRDEVEWLSEELKPFIATLQPEHAPLSPQETENKYEKHVESDGDVYFRIPDAMRGFRTFGLMLVGFGLLLSLQVFIIAMTEDDPWINKNSYWFLLIPVIGFVLLLSSAALKKYVRQVLEMTSKGIRLRKEFLGKNIGERKYTSTAILQPSDITWYYKERKPVIGLNHKEETFELYLYQFQSEDVEQLVQEIKETFLKLKSTEISSKESPVMSSQVMETTSDASTVHEPGSSFLEETDIKKVVKKEGHVQLRIPGNYNEIVRHQLMFPLIMIVFFGFVNFMMLFGGGETTDAGRVAQPFLILIWFAGIGGLIMVLHHIWGYTILDLTPEWTRIRYEFLRLGFSRRIPTAAISNVEIAHRYTINNKFHIEGINIYTATKTLQFGSHLPTNEKQWLIVEIQQYLSTIETPKELSGLTPKIGVSPRGIEIVVPMRNESERLGFLMFWLTGWTVGGVFSISKFISGLQGDEPLLVTIFLGIWLLGWVGGEIYAIRTLTWNLFGKEKILLSKEQFTIGYFLFERGKEQHFEITNIHNLRLTPQHEKNAGKLMFDYGQKPVTFCKHVSNAEARTLLRKLSEILTFQCHAVERIVFGTHHIPDDDPATTLRNPDVSELTFPFVRLQQIIIQTDTYNFHLVERFLTYAVNYIGQEKLKNIEVHLYGDPTKFHLNLQNSFQNLFKQVYEHEEHQ